MEPTSSGDESRASPSGGPTQAAQQDLIFDVPLPAPPFGCPHCANKKYTTHTALGKHMKLSHNGTIISFRCAGCGFRADLKNVRNHLKKHPNCVPAPPSPRALSPAHQTAPPPPTPPAPVSPTPTAPKHAEPRRKTGAGGGERAPAPLQPDIVRQQSIPAEERAVADAEGADGNVAPPPPLQGPKRVPPPTATQATWVKRFNEVVVQFELEEAAQDLVEAVRAKFVKKECPGQPGTKFNRRAPGPLPRRPTYDAKAASRIQKLYRRNRRRAYREVVEAESPFCQKPAGELFDHYSAIFGKRQVLNGGRPAVIPGYTEDVPPEDANPFAEEFTPEETWKRLVRCSNTAPGPDGIRYADWKRYDPFAHVLSAVCNAVQRLKFVPNSWNESRTVLLHKKGDRNDLGNWRPITMGNTMAKIHAAVLAERLGKWTRRNNRMSPQQKGFLAVDGCAEHNFILQSVIADARRNRRQVSMAWLDLANAFGSVSHDAIFEGLRYAGLCNEAIATIRMLYAEATTQVMSKDGPTELINIRSGVKQGCPLSPLVFNLAIEPLLRAAVAKTSGYRIHETVVDVLAYADDLVVVAENPDGLQETLDVIGEVADHLRLRFNARKCAALTIDGRKKETIDAEVSIQGAAMVTLQRLDHYDHLGVPTGFTTAPSAQKAVEKMTRELERVDGSLLAPWQKADAVNTFILPALSFHLLNGSVEKKLLTDFDKKLKTAGKRWLNIPGRASNEILYLTNSMGGLGFIPTNTLADTSQVVHAIRILNSPNVESTAVNLLYDSVKKRMRQDAVTVQDAANYLNGSMEGALKNQTDDVSNMWTRLRAATARLRRKKFPLEWKPVQDRIAAFVNGGQVRPHHSEYSMRAMIRDAERNKLLAKPDQGKTWGILTAHSAANFFLRNGDFTRFAEWRFIHRSRLNTVPLNAATRTRQNNNKRCRRCGVSDETLAHVLCHCRPHMKDITKRHDAVLNRLVKAIRPAETAEVRINKRVPGHNEDLRPDLVVTDDANMKTIIIDVTCPFENKFEAFEAARNEKINKYAKIAEFFRLRGHAVELHSFIVGPLGGYDPYNDHVLNVLGVSRKYGDLMKKLMVADVIRASRNIYVHHVTGRRQEPLEEESTAAPPQTASA